MNKSSCYIEEDQKIYDGHTLCIEPLDYEIDEVIDMVHDTLKKLKKDHKIKTKSKLNYKKVKFDDGEEDYMIYLRVSNKAAYNVLSGLNKDGSPRVIEYEDPDFVPPKKSYDDVLEEKLKKVNPTDWYVVDEIERKLIKEYSPKILRKEMPPLVVLDDSDEEDKIFIDRAYIPYGEDKFKHNVIWANVPGWTTIKILRDIFSDFATYPYKKCGKNKEFPLISIKDNKYGRSAYIAYDDKSYDAEFAMFINEYTNLKNPVTGMFENVQFKHFGT